MNNEITHILKGVFLFIALAIIVRLILVVTTLPQDSFKPTDSESQALPQPPLSELAKKGKAIFKNNCASCHAINKVIVGPALAGIESRWPTKKLLYMWIKNWQKAVATGDPYPNKIKDYSPSAMSAFYISDEDIDSILAYIKESSSPQTIAQK